MKNLQNMFLLWIAFTFSTQMVFDMLFATGDLQHKVYSSQTYSTSALIDFITACIAVYFAMKSKE